MGRRRSGKPAAFDAARVAAEPLVRRRADAALGAILQQNTVVAQALLEKSQARFNRMVEDQKTVDGMFDRLDAMNA